MPRDHGSSDASVRVTWHARSVDDVLTATDSDPAGLGAACAAARLDRHGPNRLPATRRRGPVRRFLAQFHNLLIYVLLAAAATTAALDHWVDTGVILAVVLVNAAIGFVQEGKAERALAAIRDMLAPRATVLRDGRRQSVAGEALVPGDIVVLDAGDRVPADLRLLDGHGLTVDEAVLTGESVAVDKTPEPVAADAALGDRRCMAFSGTMVSAGQGRGVVVATGAGTEIGRISGLIATVEQTTTPLLRQMDVFARWLTLFILCVSAAILGVGVALGDAAFDDLFMTVVGLSVAAIPEGLPAILTVTLAIGVQGMARRHAIVRRLPAIEALGSVSVICSDKTGTLTRNEMTVGAVATAERLFTLSGSGYTPVGQVSLDHWPVEPADYPLLIELGRAALLCNDAELVQDHEDEWHVAGDPMEGALVAMAGKLGLDALAERAWRRRVGTVPFDARHRYMASRHRSDDGAADRVYVKGAPEQVLAMSRWQHDEAGNPVALDPDYWQDRAQTLARQGQRVLAIASAAAPEAEHGLNGDHVDGALVLLGLVGLIDPPRAEAVTAVAQCRSAGIRVKMITGDHAGTAAAIARQLGLENPAEVIQGAEIDAMDDATLGARVAAVDVFARTSPEHKLRLVQALQAAGEVVAMTGDGVNDAPALKRADIGIAMGRKGTEAAKEAAEMVLADDNFATIAAAVKAGRTVYDNLKKAIVFLLPVNGGESLSLIAAILLGLTLPITPVQILWVNMVSSVVLAMTLAFEPAERDIMARPPRGAREPILSRFVLWRVSFVSVLFSLGIFAKFALAQVQGASLEEARTVAVNTLVVMEIFYLFSVRYLTNPSITLRGVLGTGPVLIAITAVTALQFLFTYAPFMAAFFDTRPLSVGEGFQVVAVGVVLLLILEAEKRVVRALERRHRSRRAPAPPAAAGAALARRAPTRPSGPGSRSGAVSALDPSAPAGRSGRSARSARSARSGRSG
ncbi:HAD-IC family P-type ATPase, partial [Rhodothalassium salexigens]|uniref:HAD-IC family P-type ATPase n=1 Tax=Rhodothalassium salexigens TaxID=1086 RepID=UPI001912DB93